MNLTSHTTKQGFEWGINYDERDAMFIATRPDPDNKETSQFFPTNLFRLIDIQLKELRKKCEQHDSKLKKIKPMPCLHRGSRAIITSVVPSTHRDFEIRVSTILDDGTTHRLGNYYLPDDGIKKIATPEDEAKVDKILALRKEADALVESLPEFVAEDFGYESKKKVSQ